MTKQMTNSEKLKAVEDKIRELVLRINESKNIMGDYLDLPDLEAVLEAIYKEGKEIGIDCSGGFIYVYPEDWGWVDKKNSLSPIKWRYGKPLDQQSTEVWDFLYSLFFEA